MATRIAAVTNRDHALYESVAAQLARAEHFGLFSYISTPLLFPSGGTVVVRVSRSIDGFLVTDHGLGSDEAAIFDGQHHYSRIAPKVAELANIGFDQHSFFVIKTDESHLAGAVTTVANCVHEAVTQVFYKVEEHKALQATERVYERLARIFEPRHVARDVTVIGASTHEWEFDVSVKTPHGITLFEAVSKHHNSIFSTVAKFHDVARSENPPARVAVIGKRNSYGAYLSLLSQAGRVIELAANDDAYRKLAA